MRPPVCLSLLLALGCGSQGTAPGEERGPACSPAAGDAAPTFTQIFSQYLGPGTPGHCGDAHCHGEPGANVWVCGASAHDCYRGLLAAGLVDPEDPARSLIGDASRSPLLWVNPSGDMPLDGAGPLPAARAAILAWVAACAPDD